MAFYNICLNQTVSMSGIHLNLEVFNLLKMGISSFNIRGQVPSDIPEHYQYISPGNIKSQEWLDKVDKWTQAQKMMINVNKTKTMIFNYSDNYQFTTRITINIYNQNVELIDSTKLFCTIISNNIKTLLMICTSFFRK